MITRIRYREIAPGNTYCSFSIPICYDLTLTVIINHKFEIRLVNQKDKIIYLEKCTSLQMAKRKARKKLQELGLNFNNEIRRKKNG